MKKIIEKKLDDLETEKNKWEEQNEGNLPSQYSNMVARNITMYSYQISELKWVLATLETQKDLVSFPTDDELQERLDELPYTKHLDDGQYNDGVITGFEMGVEWVKERHKIS